MRSSNPECLMKDLRQEYCERDGVRVSYYNEVKCKDTSYLLPDLYTIYERDTSTEDRDVSYYVYSKRVLPRQSTRQSYVSVDVSVTCQSK